MLFLAATCLAADLVGWSAITVGGFTIEWQWAALFGIAGFAVLVYWHLFCLYRLLGTQQHLESLSIEIGQAIGRGIRASNWNVAEQEANEVIEACLSWDSETYDMLVRRNKSEWAARFHDAGHVSSDDVHAAMSAVQAKVGVLRDLKEFLSNLVQALRH